MIGFSLETNVPLSRVIQLVIEIMRGGGSGGVGWMYCTGAYKDTKNTVPALKHTEFWIGVKKAF